MGHILGPFGVHGWIKINPYTEYVDSLMDYATWWLGRGDDQWREVRVIDGRVGDATLVVKLHECNDRAQAVELKGMLVAVPRDQLPALPENGAEGYYWSDLIGVEVVSLTGEKLGKVTELFEMGANDVMRIQDDREAKEMLIPFIGQYVIKVDLHRSQIIVDWERDY